MCVSNSKFSLITPRNQYCPCGRCHGSGAIMGFSGIMLGIVAQCINSMRYVGMVFNICNNDGDIDIWETLKIFKNGACNVRRF